jgi:hypothetical protein
LDRICGGRWRSRFIEHCYFYTPSRHQKFAKGENLPTDIRMRSTETVLDHRPSLNCWIELRCWSYHLRLLIPCDGLAPVSRTDPLTRRARVNFFAVLRPRNLGSNILLSHGAHLHRTTGNKNLKSRSETLHDSSIGGGQAEYMQQLSDLKLRKTTNLLSA